MYRWPRECEMEPFVLLAFFPCFIVIFGQFEANTCYEAKCDLVGSPLFYRRFGCIGVLEAKFTICPLSTPKLALLHSKDATF